MQLSLLRWITLSLHGPALESNSEIATSVEHSSMHADGVVFVDVHLAGAASSALVVHCSKSNSRLWYSPLKSFMTRDHHIFRPASPHIPPEGPCTLHFLMVSSPKNIRLPSTRLWFLPGGMISHLRSGP